MRKPIALTGKELAPVAKKINNARVQQMQYPLLHSLIREEWYSIRVLAFDPGECNTGWALWSAPTIESGELRSHDHIGMMRKLEAFMPKQLASYVVCEQYSIYPSMAATHINSVVPTIRVIGALELLCLQQGLKIEFQSASMAKQAVTDRRLMQWNLYKRGYPHARDAVRHLVRLLTHERKIG